MKVRQLYYTMVALNGTQNDAAHFDIIAPCLIRAVIIQMHRTDALTNGEYIRAEVSSNSTNQLAVNDANNMLLQAAWSAHLLTSGAILNAPISVFGLSVTFKAGDRIYLNLITGQATTGFVTALVYCD